MMEEDDSKQVVVIAGRWSCNDSGEWDFILCNGWLSRVISIPQSAAFSDVIGAVQTAFTLGDWVPTLTFWLPEDLSVFHIKTKPPVHMHNDDGVRFFLKEKAMANHLNLLMTVGEVPSDMATTAIERVDLLVTKDSCVQRMRQSVGRNIDAGRRTERLEEHFQKGGVLMLSVEETATARTQPQNNNENPTANAEETQGGGTDYSGIIRLAALCTPQRVHAGCESERSTNSKELIWELQDKPQTGPNDSPGIIRLADICTPEFSPVLCQNEIRVNTQLFISEPVGSTQTARRILSLEEQRLTEKGKAIAIDSPASPSSINSRQGSSDFQKYIDELNGAGQSVRHGEPSLRDDNCYSVASSGEGDATSAAGSVEGQARRNDISTNVFNYCRDRLNVRRSLEAQFEAESDEVEVPDTQVQDESVTNQAVQMAESQVISKTPIMSAGDMRNIPAGQVIPFIDCSDSTDNVARTVPAFDDGSQTTNNDPGAASRRQIRLRSADNTELQVARVELPEEEDEPMTEDADPEYDEGTSVELYRTGVCVKDGELGIGKVFRSKEELHTTIALYAIKKMFTVKVLKSDRTRLIMVCVDSLCPWRVFAKPVTPDASHFEIRTVTLKHTCSIESRANYGKQATARIIGEVLQSRYANGRVGPRATEIPELMLAELKVGINYNKAWRAKEEAIMKAVGSQERSYQLLATHMHLLKEANEGTVYKLVGKLNNRGAEEFKYVFFALGASIAGIKHLRKVVVVDGTHLTGRTKGCLLTASMQDGNFKIFPIAFAIVDGENAPAWSWFFKQLQDVICDSPDLVIVSDRHRAIIGAVKAEYPNCFHGACAVHLERNVKSYYKVNGISYLVAKAARAYTVDEYREWFAEISRRSPACAAYLDEIPLENWTQSHCTAMRYNIMSSNIAESWNKAIVKYRDRPIIGLIEGIRTKLMEWFCVRRAEAEAHRHRLTKHAAEKLLAHLEESAGMSVIRVSTYTFQVAEDDLKTYYVDIYKKTCSCKKFQKTKLPCSHAMAATRFCGVDATILAGDEYETTTYGETYRNIIYPVQNIPDATIPDEIQQEQYVPPSQRATAGRRRKRRFPSRGEVPRESQPKKRKCSMCQQSGHNRITCESRAK